MNPVLPVLQANENARMRAMLDVMTFGTGVLQTYVPLDRIYKQPRKTHYHAARPARRWKK